MARKYGTFTPARRAALKRASLASAAKRRGRGRGKRKAFAKGGKGRKALVYTAVGLGAAAAASQAVNYKSAGGKKSHGSYPKYAKSMRSFHKGQRQFRASNRDWHKNQAKVAHSVARGQSFGPSVAKMHAQHAKTHKQFARSHTNIKPVRRHMQKKLRGKGYITYARSH